MFPKCVHDFRGILHEQNVPLKYTPVFKQCKIDNNICVHIHVCQ